MFRDRYVPTAIEDIERGLSAAALRPGERLLDLGSGDGRVVRAAAARGAKAVGVEMDEELVRKTRLLGVEIVHGDYMKNVWAGYHVITANASEAHWAGIREKFQREGRSGARLVWLDTGEVEIHA